MLSSGSQSPPFPVASLPDSSTHILCLAPIVPSQRESCLEAGLQPGYSFHFILRKELPSFLWLQDGQASQSSPMCTVYLHRECPVRPSSGGIPASSTAHSCLPALFLRAKPPARWSPGSASVSGGFAWLPVGCFWGLGVCLRTLQENGQNKEKAAARRKSWTGNETTLTILSIYSFALSTNVSWDPSWTRSLCDKAGDTS